MRHPSRCRFALQELEPPSGRGRQPRVWWPLDVHADRPYEPQQLPSDGRDDLLLGLASGHEPAVTMEEPMLGFPGHLFDRLALPALLSSGSLSEGGVITLFEGVSGSRSHAL